jgi:hypothetical protein
MRKAACKSAALVCAALLLVGARGDQTRMPLSIGWTSQRVIPDGTYAITHNEAFLFARLTPASAIVTPTDIHSLDNADTIPKGTVLAWDFEHKTACEPIRRRGQRAFMCLEDPDRTGKFTAISEIESTAVLRRRGYLPAKISYEYLLGRFAAIAPRAIDPVDPRTFAPAEQTSSIDIRIRYEGQYKMQQTSYSVCTIRNMGKNWLSFNNEVIAELCPPEFIVVNATEFPKVLSFFGYNITLLDFDPDNTHIKLAKLGG